MTDNIFKQDAKILVDCIFDKKMFNDTMTRDNMNIFEEIIAMNLQFKYESYISCKEFKEKLEKSRDKQKAEEN